MSDTLSTRQKVALCAALGTGVMVGATGLVVYQRLSRNVGLKVTGTDFSQDIATLTTHIERLRQDIECLRGAVNPSIEFTEDSSQTKPLKSVLRKSTRYQSQPSFENVAPEGDGSLELPGFRHKRTRNLSWGSGLTNGSASSSGTEYFSAISDDDDEYLTPDMDPIMATTGLGYEETELVEFFAKVDDLMEGSQEQQQLSLKLITDSLTEYNNNPSYLWRLCKSQYLCAVLAGHDGAKDIKKDLIVEAVQTGERALNLDQRNSEAHKWYAISLGSRGEFAGVKEKILDGFEFKSHIDKAAELNPGDHITHHLLGRFCYEVSQLSWIERKMASTLFASPPSASLPEAIDHFLQAERLKPDGWKENRLFIAKCHIGLGEYNQAVIWLDKADSIPLASQDVREGIKDKLSQQEVDELLVKYEKYRCEK
eukprot:GFUD01032304.1.p1 GENE.GFUD01032304.1~~GFUD01032304.1.p1  ORF type:complete len:425 (+),score=92.78 GFUD01032304.1:53-1327(+)